MENKKQYEKQKKSNYNQYIEEEGIKEEKSKENQKTIKEVLQPKLKGDENNQINLIDELKINKTKTDISKEIIYDNGDKYIGDIENELKHGQGIIYYNEKNNEQRIKYEGTWKNDKQNGKGCESWPEGACYEGDYVNGKKKWSWGV